MKKITLALIAIVAMSGLNAPAYVSADADGGDNCVSTSILGEGGQYCDSGDGEGILNILGIVLTVLTYGVGTLGVLGLVVVGIQYLTAGGNEAQMTKAKTRIIEIVIGLVAYALMYALLQWLLPGGILGGS